MAQDRKVSYARLIQPSFSMGSSPIYSRTSSRKGRGKWKCKRKERIPKGEQVRMWLSTIVSATILPGNITGVEDSSLGTSLLGLPSLDSATITEIEV